MYIFNYLAKKFFFHTFCESKVKVIDRLSLMDGFGLQLLRDFYIVIVSWKKTFLLPHDRKEAGFFSLVLECYAN